MERPSRLTRPISPIPADITEALAKRELMGAYEKRPPYQRNDYIGWITRSVGDYTRQKRLDQMLSELEQGDVYMKMAWKSNSKSGLK